MQGKLTGLHHIGVYCADIDVSLDFYLNKLGFNLTYRAKINPSTELAFINIGTCIIELVCSQNAQARPSHGVVDHIAITAQNIDDVVAQLRQKGVEVGEVMQSGAIFNGVKNVFFTGPDGESIELFEEL